MVRAIHATGVTPSRCRPCNGPSTGRARNTVTKTLGHPDSMYAFCRRLRPSGVECGLTKPDRRPATRPTTREWPRKWPRKPSLCTGVFTSFYLRKNVIFDRQRLPASPPPHSPLARRRHRYIVRSGSGTHHPSLASPLPARHRHRCGRPAGHHRRTFCRTRSCCPKLLNTRYRSRKK